jgi:hypothetical protein
MENTTTSPAHTVGEWRIKPSTVSQSEICILPDLGQVVCDICPLADENEMMANACLISAAPELLDALRDATASLNDMYKLNLTIAGHYFGAALLERMRDAIAKAEGRNAPHSTE